MGDEFDDSTYDRPIWQVLLKTGITHALGLLVYSQLNHLLHVPSKHNARLFRLIVFAFLPTVILGQFAFDIVKAAIRLLQNPHEVDVQSKLRALKFYWDGMLGVRCTTEDEGVEEREETIRLLDIAAAEDVQPQKPKWTWKRVSGILLCLLAIFQAVGIIVTFARRSLQRSCRKEEIPCRDTPWYTCDEPTQIRYNCSHSFTGLDFRNLYVACASIIISVLSIYLLAAGNTWTYAPSTSLTGEEDVATRSSAVLGEMQRLLMDYIFGTLIQEFIAVETYYDRWGDNGTPKYVTIFMGTLDRISMSPVEWVLIILAVFMVTVFKQDIAARLGVKTKLVYGVLIAAIGIWLTLDNVLLFVTDAGHFILGHYGSEADGNWGEKWSDPIEKWVPVM
ncbi:hypothetical protein M409DRAFT_23298 [Zasmidium cellare ATCC 36951]|uniref:Uncharacterized protein n=1 Tax=Zasmidium cellare ATCC 36951 TaxID=1080233 RepID=A0A6A6CHE6_ZASCE|nr:uncharacterized protein M409DRAFT_23298 [Zasmidium cellare ATCC 36951]KAF2166667.1 hypothetical protein M409DRAFT_23298 [Zasmidium cellare ATCC 36951]